MSETTSAATGGWSTQRLSGLFVCIAGFVTLVLGYIHIRAATTVASSSSGIKMMAIGSLLGLWGLLFTRNPRKAVRNQDSNV